MLDDFFIDSLIEFTIIIEDVFDFFHLINNESILFDEGVHSDSTADKLLIDGYEVL